MNQSIWKFPIEVTRIQSIIMPKAAKMLTVQNQNEIPCIWAIVDLDSPPEERQIETFTTGAILPNEPTLRIYIGTYQIGNGEFVGHVFEKTAIKP